MFKHVDKHVDCKTYRLRGRHIDWTPISATVELLWLQEHVSTYANELRLVHNPRQEEVDESLTATGTLDDAHLGWLPSAATAHAL
jgi:hypothetical protein